MLKRRLQLSNYGPASQAADLRRAHKGLIGTHWESHTALIEILRLSSLGQMMKFILHLEFFRVSKTLTSRNRTFNRTGLPLES